MDSHSGAAPLLILGASARAAARSALRRGRAPMAIDMYGDLDLRRIVSASRTVAPERFPGDLALLAADMPPAPFLATGGVENAPHVLRALERARANEGPSADAVTAVRDPARWTAALAEAELPFLRVRDAASPPLAGEWLVKPLRSCGGAAIGEYAPGASVCSGSFFQERAAGVACSAVFEARDGGVELLGASEQLVGEARLGARPWAYCGSIAPLAAPPFALEVLERIGVTLAERFGLRGLFGVDAILDADGVPWPVEINPRYTASVEVLERLRDADAPAAFGKAIVFVEQPCVTPEAPLDELLGDLTDEDAPLESIADVPMPDTALEAGAPLLTLLAPGASPRHCRERLLTAAQAVRERLPIIHPPPSTPTRSSCGYS